MKEEEIFKMGFALYFYFFLFGNFSWITNTRPWLSKKYKLYFMYIDFIRSSSSNCWIKINFNSKLILNSKMLCKFLSLLLVFIIAKGCHQDFNLFYTTIVVIHHFFEWKMAYTLIMIATISLTKCDKQP